MHPLLALLATRPQLLIDHAQAYAALVNDDFDQAFTAWRRRAVLQTATMVCLAVAVVLAGVALMMWAVNPQLQLYASWVLCATPLIPLLVAFVCMVKARNSNRQDAFANLSRQLSADLVMLRAAGSP